MPAFSVTATSSNLFFQREEYHGIQIFRTRGTRFSKRILAGRVCNYITYFFCACITGLVLDRPNVIVTLTDPPIVGLAAYLSSRRFRVPWVISYRDIFPEVARLAGGFRNPLVELILDRTNRFLVAKADRVVALGETMHQKLIQEKGAPAERTCVIEDWATCSEIVPGPKENPFSVIHGLADRFVVMHSGNVGLSQGLEHLIQAAARLKEVSDLRVVLIGEGVKKSDLEKQTDSLRLENVLFLPYLPKNQLRDSFSTADVFILSLKKGLAGYSVPSKLYAILASGRPYVAAVEESCEVTAITRRFSCGLLACPEDAADLAEKILVLYRDPALRQRMGENARKAAFQFDRPRGVQRYHALFQSLLKA